MFDGKAVVKNHDGESLKLSPDGILRRHPANPIITGEAYPGANSIFNSGVILKDGRHEAILRIELRTGDSCLVPAHSNDGLHFELESAPMTFPHREPFTSHYTAHNYDPRLTEIEGEYYLTYAAGTPWGAVIGMASTRDFVKWRHYDLTSPARNRNSVLFSRKINGKFARLERPFGNPHTEKAYVWYSESPDLEHWGHYRFVMGSHQRWNDAKVGPGAPPIYTEEGWLAITHGVRKTCSGFIYCIGACLLDLDEPWRVIARPKCYLMQPQAMYERIGDVANVLFPTAAVHHVENDEVWIYYGAADSCVAVAVATLGELIDFCKNG
jgi:beta-1,4-mannooligosaccharide/beta-1,4-mannosyl-N-acetylglucosamine phosphorylase